ncbi:hypothetical protein AWB77_04676 [Caballeronia fortuita]|uniref:Uncharacterized protein n=1 Tax=Caballeronia fortuita TaxID=1777138 RepID=A0A158CXF3_9BURK|nr:hypothetical protein [Caballeronia fortuita]SAK87028.1 hypothetical protein AWB77_04676 [Caballeronia fortuita]
MNEVIIYLNPRFGAPRHTLALIQNANIEATIVAIQDGEVIIDMEGERA